MRSSAGGQPRASMPPTSALAMLPPPMKSVLIGNPLQGPEVSRGKRLGVKRDLFDARFARVHTVRRASRLPLHDALDAPLGVDDRGCVVDCDRCGHPAGRDLAVQAGAAIVLAGVVRRAAALEKAEAAQCR